MAENTFPVGLRESTGKGVARKLRAAGLIPGVCYGKGTNPTSIELDPNALRRLLEHSKTGMNTILELAMDGGPLDGMSVLIRELQKDPVRGHYLHADLLAIDLEERIGVSVPIHISGKAIGIENGGVLDQALREVDLECLPISIPNEIVVDVTDLDMGDSLHVRDLPLPAGVELRSDPDLSVVSIVAPAKEEEVAPAEGLAEGEEGVEGDAAGDDAKSTEGGGDDKGGEDKSD